MAFMTETQSSIYPRFFYDPSCCMLATDLARCCTEVPYFAAYKNICVLIIGTMLESRRQASNPFYKGTVLTCDCLCNGDSDVCLSYQPGTSVGLTSDTTNPNVLSCSSLLLQRPTPA